MVYEVVMAIRQDTSVVLFLLYTIILRLYKVTVKFYVSEYLVTSSFILEVDRLL